MPFPFIKYVSYTGAAATASQTINIGFSPIALDLFCDGATRNRFFWTRDTSTWIWNVGPTLVGAGGGQLTASTSTISLTITAATLGFTLPAGRDEVNGANLKYYGIAYNDNQ